MSAWARIVEKDGSTVAYVPSECEAALLAEAPTMRHLLSSWIAWTDAMRQTSDEGLPDEAWLAPIRECIRRSHGRL
jgi:hypothetical protein